MTEAGATTQEPEAEPVGEGGATGTPSGEPEPETFPKEYVQRLRTESAGYRVKAQRADDATAKLTALLIEKATADLLADPTDLPITDDLLGEDGWPDVQKIEDAARALIVQKPHLGRRPSGDVGQGVRGEETDTVSLAAMLRRGAA
jgi:hypothetical protein